MAAYLSFIAVHGYTAQRTIKFNLDPGKHKLIFISHVPYEV